MEEFQSELRILAEAYWRRLQEEEVCRRMSHHMAHAAPEAWLSQELAYLVNEAGEAIGLAGWSALLEAKKVDVTLFPPKDGSDAPIHLELKLVLPNWWANWDEVYSDLGCHPRAPTKRRKPPGDYSVCFIVEAQSPGRVNPRQQTLEKYRQRLQLIPAECVAFQPLDDEFPPLLAVHISPPIPTCWSRPVHGQWPEGYRAVVRILWVKSCKDTDPLASNASVHMDVDSTIP